MGRCLLRAPTRIIGLTKRYDLTAFRRSRQSSFRQGSEILQSLNWLNNSRCAAPVAVGKLNHHNRGQHYDGETDRVLVLSDDGPTQNLIRGPFPRALLNGQAQPNPMQLRSGVTYRFRLINIRTDYAATVSIFDDGEPAQWRVIAKDGADLPASQATMRAATLTFAAGEIYDVEFTPTTPGSLTLQFGAPKQGPIPGQATDVQVVVR